MTVRQLIEHLAQFDPELEVRNRDPNNPLILVEIEEHQVQLEDFVPPNSDDDEQLVVAIG